MPAWLLMAPLTGYEGKQEEEEEEEEARRTAVTQTALQVSKHDRKGWKQREVNKPQSGVDIKPPLCLHGIPLINRNGRP